jgi:multisubunit Na+/H+ antiporter MnhE subunit
MRPVVIWTMGSRGRHIRRELGGILQSLYLCNSIEVPKVYVIHHFHTVQYIPPIVIDMCSASIAIDPVILTPSRRKPL